MLLFLACLVDGTMLCVLLPFLLYCSFSPYFLLYTKVQVLYQVTNHHQYEID